jgi:hypothetical protein
MKILYYIALGLLLFGVTCDVKGEPMEIHNPLPPSIIQFDTGELFKIKRLEIGGWNCVTTPTKNIVHGLGAYFPHILPFYVAMIKDDGTMAVPINMFFNLADPWLIGGGVYALNDTLLQL